MDFNPRSPCGERPRDAGRRSRHSSNFNPRSPCGERLDVCLVGLPLGIISTHAPRAGSDVTHEQPVTRAVHISTHAPRAGSDPTRAGAIPALFYFNPRSPCGERLPIWQRTPGRSDFNPRSPCGERPEAVTGPTATPYFNPRSPCGERPQYIALIVFCCQYADQRRAIGPEKQAARTSKRPNAVRTSPVTLGSLMFAPQTTAPRIPRLHTSVSRPRALSSFDTCCPDNRIASCPSQGR